MTISELELIAALKRYMSLDDDRRTGMALGEADWAACREQARETIARVKAREIK